MMKKDIDLIWGRDPEKVFMIVNTYGSRVKVKYARIVGKKANGYLLDTVELERGLHAEKCGTDRLPEWRIVKSYGVTYSCRDLSQPYGSKFDGMTLEQVAVILNAEEVAEWHEEKAELQVKPLAIAEILARTNLSERDLQDTPKAVVVALRDALFMAGVVA